METLIRLDGIWLFMVIVVVFGITGSWFGIFTDALTKRKAGKTVLLLAVFFLYLLGPMQETIQAAGQPDLILTGLSVSPNTTAIAPGTILSVSNTVKNQGDAAAGSFTVAFHLSTNTTYGDGDDVVITATRAVNSLATGANSKATSKLTIPLTTPVGTYHLCVMVDSGNSVSESNEANNTFCTEGTGHVTEPDLVMTAVTPTTSTVSSTATLSVTNTVENQGALSAGSFLVAYHLSTNTTYGDGDDVVLPTTRAVNSLAVGARSTATTKLSIPLDTPAGSYFVCAKTDSANAVLELDETNNTQCSSTQVTVPASDLLLTAVSTTTTAIAPGKTLSASSTAKNQGGFPAGSSLIAFHLSTNTTYGDGDDVVITATRAVNSLAAAAISTATSTLTIPPSTPVGTYHLCAIADSGDAVSESNEANNTFCTTGTIQVTEPDLVLMAVSTTATAIAPGKTLSVSSTAKNQGSVAAGSSLVAFHLSTNTTYGDGDDLVLTATRAVNSLAAAASSTAATMLTVPLNTPAGSYFICAKTDSANAVVELDEANNTRCSAIPVTISSTTTTTTSTTTTTTHTTSTTTSTSTTTTTHTTTTTSTTTTTHTTTTTTTSTTTTTLTSGTSFLFYQGSIFAVDPANPDSPITVDAQTTSGATGFDGYTFHSGPPASGTDIHPRTVVYGGNDGHLYKVNALKSGGSPTHIQVSNETGANTVCNSSNINGITAGLNTDPANFNNTSYFYLLPGSDATCGTSDDVWQIVKVGMTATDTPIPAKEPVATLHNATTGAIIGWLAEDGTNLNRYDTNFSNLGTVTTFTNSVTWVGWGTTPDTFFLHVDDQLYLYHVSTHTLSSSLHTFSCGVVCGNDIIREDSVNGYFNDGNSIYKVPLNGNTSASLLVSETDSILQLLLTNNDVVYNTFSISLGLSGLKAVAKTGGTPFDLDTSAGAIPLWGAGVRVYYSVGETAKVVREDGTIESSIANASWVGISLNTTITLGNTNVASRIILAEGMTGTSVANSTLKSFNAATNTLVATLGTVPTDISSLFFTPEDGDNLLGNGVTNTGSHNKDVFFVNTGIADSLARITDTTDKDESLIIFTP